MRLRCIRLRMGKLVRCGLCSSLKMENIKKYWYFIVAIFAVSIIFKPTFCFVILGLIMLYLGIDYKIIIDEIEKMVLSSKENVLNINLITKVIEYQL